MLLSQTTLLLGLSTAIAAAPVERRWSFGAWWHPEPTASFLDFDKRHPGFNVDVQAASCSMSDAYNNMPKSTLPAPASGLSLAHVAIGRGTQNYTCDLSNATAVPAAVGAVATLFNVSCMAADSPALLSRLSSISLEMPTPSTTDEASPAYLALSGHHYFTDLTTAFFNMDTTDHNYGYGAFKKVNASAAPTDAVVGQNGQGYGAVPWLKLDSKNVADQIYQEVFRLNTAGGNPPKTCQGQPAAFEVQYAAEYWLFE